MRLTTTARRITAGLALGLLALAACGPSAKPTPYANPDWGFSVTFQAPPVVTPAKAGATPGVLVEAKGGGHDFAVNVLDASGTTSTPDQILSGAPETVANAMDVDVGATTYASLNGVMGREVRFDKDAKPALLMRIFVSNNRVYEVSADVPKGVNDPMVKAYLDSFQLTGAAAAPPPPPPATNAASNAASNAATNAAGTNTAG